MSDPVEAFRRERRAAIEGYRSDPRLSARARGWVEETMARRYVYNFDWLGRPIIQYPADIVALQEVVWATRPDVIVETGIAHGGSLALSAGTLALLDLADAAAAGESLDPARPRRKVIGVDIDIRAHNRAALDAHALRPFMHLVEGHSIAPETVAEVRATVGDAARVMVCLDSSHTHDHVLAELTAYAPLVTAGCYCVVLDTFLEDMPAGFIPDRPWDRGNSPRTALQAWLATDPGFEIDREIGDKLLLSAAPDGFLRRIR
ncbi:MAG: cephalosporin hydroxylase family protein [Pseudomonadota bacterium]